MEENVALELRWNLFYIAGKEFNCQLFELSVFAVNRIGSVFNQARREEIFPFEMA